MRNKTLTALALMASLCVLAPLSVHAGNLFGEAWKAMPAVTDNQTRIVYYFPVDNEVKAAANIYVDGEFHTSLVSGGYTVFCLAPGMHSLGSFTGDAPTYEGKKRQPWRDNLAAGKTFYIRANLDETGRPLVSNAEEAEQQLTALRKQTHLLSRASSVIACETNVGESRADYVFSSDLLFKFGSANSNDISHEGREAIQQFVAMLNMQERKNKRIVITGFTDPIGEADANFNLGKRRAEAVKTLLVDNGLLASDMITQSMGETQVSKVCKGTIKEKKACYRDERRVVIGVENN